MILQKSGLEDYELNFVLGEIFSRIEIVPISKILPCFDEARKIMDPIDPDDTVFIALALCTNNDGVWTNDNHYFQIQDKIKDRIRIWTTAELIISLEIEPGGHQHPMDTE